MVTDLRPADETWPSAPNEPASPWDEPWDRSDASRTDQADRPPAWHTPEAPPVAPAFSRVRRGYDTE